MLIRQELWSRCFSITTAIAELVESADLGMMELWSAACRHGFHVCLWLCCRSIRLALFMLFEPVESTRKALRAYKYLDV